MVIPQVVYVFAFTSFYKERSSLCCGTLQLEQRGSMLPHRLQILGKIELYHYRSLFCNQLIIILPALQFFALFSRSPACCLLTCPARENKKQNFFFSSCAWRSSTSLIVLATGSNFPADRVLKPSSCLRLTSD